MFNPKICYIQVGGTVLPIKLQRFFRFLKKLNFSAFNFLLFIYVYSEHIISISTSVEAIKRNRVRPKHFFQDLSILVYMIVDKKIFFIYKSQKNKIAPWNIWPLICDDIDILYDLCVKDTNDDLDCYVDFKHSKSYNFTKIGDLAVYIYSNIYMHLYNKFYKTTYNIYTNIRYFSNNFIKICHKTTHTILFLRKQKCFNKGRYSRNRQLYRTGVYWCLYINIIALVGLNYLFYKFTINFMFYWWSFFITLNFFIVPQCIKNNLYTYTNIKNILYSLVFIYSRIFELTFSPLIKNNLYFNIAFLQKKIINFFFFLRNMFI